MRLALSVILLTILGYSDTIQETTVQGDKNITIKRANELQSKERFTKTLQAYKDNIKDLEERLSKSISEEEKYELSDKLETVNNKLVVKEQEIDELNKFIEDSNLKIVQNSIGIYDKKGLEATLVYLRSKDVQTSEKNIEELAGKYLLEAKILIVMDKYDEAQKVYKQLMKYDKSLDTLFEYAHFLENQNSFSEAIKEYRNLLGLELGQEDRAITLNNLANLYSNQNQSQEALKAYQEALTIYKELVKENPKAYEIYYANTLVVGVAYLKQDKKDLIQAKNILVQEQYQDIYMVQDLLTWIEEIENP